MALACTSAVHRSTQEDENVEISCCTFTSDVWRNFNWILHGAASHIPNRPVNLAQQPSQSYLAFAKKAIVSFDVEQISPGASRHHPLDRYVTRLVKLYSRKPWGICSNTKTEQIYVADRACHSILVFGPDGEFQGNIGFGRGSLSGQLNRPIAVAFDAVGDRLFVSDKDNHRIQVFTPSGQYLFKFGELGRRAGQFKYPWGIAVSKDGVHVAVADSRNQRIQLFTTYGYFLRQFYSIKDSTGGPIDDRINYPRGVCFDNSGRYFYATDFKLRCVFQVNIESRYLVMLVPGFTAHLSRPSGIEVDSSGNIIVCDTRNDDLCIFKPNGELVNRVSAIGPTFFASPLDITILKGGHLAALDLNGRVRIF